MAINKSRKRRRIVVFALILLVLSGLGVAAYFREREPVVMIQAEKTARRSLTELVTANGRIWPVLQVKISPEVSGEIIELPVKEGQTVKKGDLLLKIKPDRYVADKNSSEANYKSALAHKSTAEANLLRADAEYKRIEALFKNQLVSDSAFLDAKTTFEVQKAQLESASHGVEMAGAALARATEDLGKTTIVSPMNGTVSRLNSRLGERVVGTAMMAGTEVMTIADLNEMEARVDIGEIDVVLIAIGQKARLEVDAFKDRKFGGEVTEIANSSKGMGMGQMGGSQSQDSAKFEVKIHIADKEPFRPGMSVTAEVETRSRTNVVSVPIVSVTTRLPKEEKKSTGKEKGSKQAASPGSANAASSTTTNAPTGSTTNTASASGTNTVAGNTNVVAGGTNVTASGTNATASTSGKKTNGGPKPIEVVFVKEGERVKMMPVKRGISDNTHVEITEGLKEGQEIVIGGYKAIARELEDGKKVRIGSPKAEAGKDKKES